MPFASVDAGGKDAFDIGDASLKVSHVYGLRKRHAWVAQGELIFDTAARPELGTDKEFFSLSITAGGVLGKAFGGNTIAFVKPTVFVGGDRPGSRGIEVGYRVLGFWVAAARSNGNAGARGRRGRSR